MRKDERKAVHGWGRWFRQNKLISPVLANEFEEQFNSGKWDKQAKWHLKRMAERYSPLFWECVPIVVDVMVFDEPIEPEPWGAVRKISGAFVTLRPFTEARGNFALRLGLFLDHSQRKGAVRDFDNIDRSIKTLAAFYNMDFANLRKYYHYSRKNDYNPTDKEIIKQLLFLV